MKPLDEALADVRLESVRSDARRSWFGAPALHDEDVTFIARTEDVDYYLAHAAEGNAEAWLEVCVRALAGFRAADAAEQVSPVSGDGMAA